MKTKFWLCLVGLGALSSGCELAYLTAHNAVYETVLYTDNLVAAIRNRNLADAAWAEARKDSPGYAYSADYVCGFKDGYADYLDANGAVAPPLLPPQHYWTTHYQSPEGHKAIEDWYAGYYHGATAAQASGYREFITVPLPPPGPGVPPHGPGPFAHEAVPPPPGGTAELPPTRPSLLPAETAPAPRPLPPPGRGG